jgi:magnesium transporter
MPSVRALAKRRSRKAGLPSGSVVYTGERQGGPVRISVIDFDEASFRETVVTSVEDLAPFRDRPTVTWINVDGVHDVELLEKLGESFGLHRLVMEDISNTDQRPKMEDYGDHLYVVLRMLSVGPDGGIVSEQLSLVLGGNFLLSFQEGIEGDVFSVIREHLRTGRGRVRKMRADYLAYAMIDAVVDHYFVVLEKLGERIESLEAELISDPKRETLGQLYAHKREMIFLHNAVWPLREVVAALGRHDSSLIAESTSPYLRDVYDHVTHIMDSVDIHREMLSGMLDVYLSSVSNRLNEVMKVLTVISLVFMPLTFIAGVYGMNFRYMPELQWRYGYGLALLLMLGVAGFMVAYFRRRKWL